jgi:motility quorum-sensing regulator/GCU-specific mRNA interferase toxin
MTEKRKPTYDLEGFKAAFARIDRLNVMGVALRNAAELGFGWADIVATVQTMQRGHFYKSMTANPISAFGMMRTTSPPLPAFCT